MSKEQFTKAQLFSFARIVYRYWIAGSNFTLDDLFEKWERFERKKLAIKKE